MSNALAAPPPLTRRSVDPGPKPIRFAIRNGDALAAYAAGRPPMPPGLELRAYAIIDLAAEHAR